MNVETKPDVFRNLKPCFKKVQNIKWGERLPKMREMNHQNYWSLERFRSLSSEISSGSSEH